MKQWISAAIERAGQPLLREVEKTRVTVGCEAARRFDGKPLRKLEDAEFRIFSQWGEDGILQYLTRMVPTSRRFFVEFGVESYVESNTRFLAEGFGWSGLLLDGGEAHIRFVSQRGLDWRNGILAKRAFVTPENINFLLEEGGATGDIDLLSVDIDGMDYWVLDAITAASPRIIVVEYNSHLGYEHAVTVPKNSNFIRSEAHYSYLYFGASLPAFIEWGNRKGYRFVGSNSAGNNAFFVRSDVAGSLPVMTAHEGWVESRFCESRDVTGRLTFLRDHRARLNEMAELELELVPSGERVTIERLYGLKR